MHLFSPLPTRDGVEPVTALDLPLRRLMRVHLANRGVWEAIVGAGLTRSVATNDEDVDRHLAAFADLVAELTD